MTPAIEEYINRVRQKYERRLFGGRGVSVIGDRVEVTGIRYLKVALRRKYHREALLFIDKNNGDIYAVKSWNERGRIIGNVKDYTEVPDVG